MKKKFIVISLLSLSLFACASNKAPINNPTPPSTENEQTTTQAYNDDSVSGSKNGYSNAGNEQATNSVYYRINRYDVDSQYNAVVAFNADFLATNNKAKIKVEGNTDDTGSVEYNLALGQRRADALKKALIAKGANITQVEAISNGKLLAKFPNDSEDGRAKNRRSDMFYTTIAPAGYHLNDQELPVVN